MFPQFTGNGFPPTGPFNQSPIKRSVRSADALSPTIGRSDFGTLVESTVSTSYTQLVAPSWSLPKDWWCFFGNAITGTALVTLSLFDSSFSINGNTYTSMKVWPGELWLLQWDGSNFCARCLQAGRYTHTVSGAVASVDFLSLFDSSADDYDVSIDGLSPVSDGAELRMRFADSGGSADSGASAYTYTIFSAVNGTGTSDVDYSNAASAISVIADPMDNTVLSNAVLQIRNINSTGLKGVFSMFHMLDSAGTNYRFLITQGGYLSANVSTGFQLYFSTGNVDAGTIRIRRHIK